MLLKHIQERITEKEIQFVIIQFMLLLSGRDVCC